MLYIPGFLLNIVNGYRLYALGGTLIKQKLYTAFRKVIVLLDFQKSGFFFTTKSAGSTINSLRQAYGTLWHCYSVYSATESKAVTPAEGESEVETPTFTEGEIDIAPIVKLKAPFKALVQVAKL